MKPNPSHIPRGYMCITCEHKHRKCNHLDFTKMQVIGVFKDDGTKEVKCTEYVKKENGKIRYELTDEQFERFEKILDDVCVKDNGKLQGLLNRPNRWAKSEEVK